MRRLVSGHVDPDGEPAEEAERQISLVQRNLCVLASGLSDAGFVPVMDWMVRHSEDLERFRVDLSMFDLYLVVLVPQPDVISRRKPWAFHRYGYLESRMTSELRGMGLWVDSDLSIEQTVDYVPAKQTVDYVLANKMRAKVDPTFSRSAACGEGQPLAQNWSKMTRRGTGVQRATSWGGRPFASRVAGSRDPHRPRDNLHC